MVLSMGNATVFEPVVPSKYTEMGEVLGFLYHTLVAEFDNDSGGCIEPLRTSLLSLRRKALAVLR